jgi:hypothetical protein
MTRRFTIFRFLLILSLLSNTYFQGFSQTDSTKNQVNRPSDPARFGIGADLVSRYIWRGKDYGNSPAIQPNVSFSVAGFKVGVWGSYGFIYNETSGNYAEFDPYVSYTLKGFTLNITDYFFPNGLTPNEHNNYFNYSKDKTGHAFEASFSWAGPEKFPLQVCVCTMFYGADKGKDSTGVYGMGTSNNYSTYLEASYQFTVKGIGVKPFVGGIPFGSAIYGPYGGIVNAGITVSKTIQLSKEYGLPVFTSIVTNPQLQNVFLVFGISL